MVRVQRKKIQSGRKKDKRCWNLIIAVRVTFGPPESAPVVFHACFIVFAVTFSFSLLENNQKSKGRVVSQ